MKACGWGALSVAATVLLAAAQPASAQSSWASEGPVVHGHHHLNVTDRAAHERFWRDTLGGVPTPWRDVHASTSSTSPSLSSPTRGASTSS